jgi:hypothetical protein
MLENAGLDGPPKTVSELGGYAKKLTAKNPTLPVRHETGERIGAWRERAPGACDPTPAARPRRARPGARGLGRAQR